MPWSTLSPLVCLAPMENYTDSPFRQIARQIAPQVVLFSEFVSVDGLHYNPDEVAQKWQFETTENPLVIQLFGNNPDYFAEAIQKLNQFPIAGIDINMGCPANKVVKNQHGAALLQNPKLAYTIAKKCVKVSKHPVSVKTRLGWDNPQQILEFAPEFEKLGISAITVHGRTYKQGFSGQANWEPIYQLKEKIKIPVIGNGDIESGQTALDKIKNLNGVMIGRQTFGNPWLLQEAYSSLQNQKPGPIEIDFKDKISIMIKHCELAVQTKGERKGILEMRKHLGAYVKGFKGAKEVRNKLVHAELLEEVKNSLINIL